jgi:hypothetical protein
MYAFQSHANHSLLWYWGAVIILGIEGSPVLDWIVNAKRFHRAAYDYGHNIIFSLFFWVFTPEFQGFSRGGSEIEPHGVYILNSECTLFALRAFIIIIIHHASCVMCHASCVMTCWRPSMCFSHSNPKLHFRSELTQPQPHSYGFLRRLYYSFFTTLWIWMITFLGSWIVMHVMHDRLIFLVIPYIQPSKESMAPKGPLFTLQPFSMVVPTSTCILIPIWWVPCMFHVLGDPKSIPRPKPSPKHERREER